MLNLNTYACSSAEISRPTNLVFQMFFFFLPRAFTFSFTSYHHFKLISFNILNSDDKYFEQVACEKHVMLNQMQPLLYVRKQQFISAAAALMPVTHYLFYLWVQFFISSLIES